MNKNLSKSYLKDLVYKVNGAAIEVHKILGPGLLESIYHRCMERELELRGINFVSEKKVMINYKGFEFENKLRCDLLVEDVLPVELKAAQSLLPIYETQLLSYMKLLKLPEGLIINFNVLNLFREGQKTMVNELYRNLPD